MRSRLKWKYLGVRFISDWRKKTEYQQADQSGRLPAVSPLPMLCLVTDRDKIQAALMSHNPFKMLWELAHPGGTQNRSAARLSIWLGCLLKHPNRIFPDKGVLGTSHPERGPGKTQDTPEKLYLSGGIGSYSYQGAGQKKSFQNIDLQCIYPMPSCNPRKITRCSSPDEATWPKEIYSSATKTRPVTIRGGLQGESTLYDFAAAKCKARWRSTYADFPCTAIQLPKDHYNRRQRNKAAKCCLGSTEDTWKKEHGNAQINIRRESAWKTASCVLN